MRVASCLVGSLWIGLGSIVVGCGSNSGSSDKTTTPTAAGGNGQGGSSVQSLGGGTSTIIGGSTSSVSNSSSGGATNPVGGTSNSSTLGGTGPSVGGSGTTSTGGSTSLGGNSSTTSTNIVGGSSAQTGGAPSTTPKGGSSSGGTSSGVTGGGTTQTAGGTTSVAGAAASCALAPALPVAANAWKPSATCVSLAQSKRADMTAAQKAAQILIAELSSVTSSGITSNHYGALFAAGHSDPPNNSATAWRDMVNAQHTAAGSDWPVLWGIDAVHGNNNVVNATMFPHNIGLGCTRNPELVKQIGRITALEMRATGINWTFAPTISAALDERWGRTFESFSEDPAVDGWLGKALVEGLQQGDIKNKQSVIACAKHFAGDGATINGVDKADVTLDSSTFQKLCVDQYQPLINYGVATIMISYSKYNGKSLSADTELVTTKLREEMGFSGIVVSDYNSILKLPGGNTPDRYGNALPSDAQVAAAMNAGIDMLMIADSGNVTATITSLSTLAGGAIAQSRIDDAVDRILAVKCEMGMWDNYSATADNSLTTQVGSAEHRAVARQAVRESLVVLKNDGNVLPLSKTANIIVAGTAADSIAKQCGGWTVDWQGLGVGSTSTASTTQGTTIQAGMKGLNAKVTYDQNGAGTGDVGVVVVGESPYAEEYGDATDLTLKARSATDDTILTTMLGKGIPIVLVIVSGRPLIIDSYIGNPNLKAVVAAWLPGSEGQGVADVLFGDFKPTGRLGHSWPKTMTQIPINKSDSDYQSDPPLYPVCHGLTW